MVVAPNIFVISVPRYLEALTTHLRTVFMISILIGVGILVDLNRSRIVCCGVYIHIRVRIKFVYHVSDFLFNLE